MFSWDRYPDAEPVMGQKYNSVKNLFCNFKCPAIFRVGSANKSIQLVIETAKTTLLFLGYLQQCLTTRWFDSNSTLLA